MTMRKTLCLFAVLLLFVFSSFVAADFPGSPFGGGSSTGGGVTEVTGDAAISVANGTTTPALSLNDNGITNAKMQYDDLGNVGFGDNVFSALTTGYSNVAIGFDTQNFNDIGRENISIGHSALRSSTNAWRNVALGARALYSATTARNNYAFGDDSQYFNETARYNISIGPETLRDNISSYYSIALGFETLIYNLAEKNIGIGRQALFSNNTGTVNVAVGDSSLYNNTTGNYNTAVGAETGNSLVGGSSQVYGSYNTWVGYNARPSTDNQTNASAFGNGAVTTDNNQVSFGNSDVASFLFAGQPVSSAELAALSGSNPANDNTRGVVVPNTIDPTDNNLVAGKCWVTDNNWKCRSNDNTVTFVVGSLTKTFSFGRDNVADTDDNIFVWPDVGPNGITLSSIKCFASSDNVVGVLSECAADNNASCTAVDDTDWTITNGVAGVSVASAAFENAGIAAGASLKWSTTSVGSALNRLSCTVRYRE